MIEYVIQPIIRVCPDFDKNRKEIKRGIADLKKRKAGKDDLLRAEKLLEFQNVLEKRIKTFYPEIKPDESFVDGRRVIVLKDEVNAAKVAVMHGEKETDDLKIQRVYSANGRAVGAKMQEGVQQARKLNDKDMKDG